MRLTCPNCGSHYEVADDVIPDNGRDVQCSSCGNTWFQRGHKSDAIQETSVETASEHDPAPAETEIAPTQVESESSRVEDEVVSAEETETPEKQAVAERQGLDQGVTDILRSEAERETAERTQQPDQNSDLDNLITNITDNPEPFGDEQVNVDMSDTTDMARSDLLPDIEEINSTLASENLVEPDLPVVEVVKGKGGFRRGFIFAVVIFSILALIYVFARQIADAFPQTAGVLSSYVDWVNTLRATVDSMMLKAVDKLTGLMAQLDSGSES